MRPLAGKTALVTGAARGIGRAIAIRLAERGVRVALADRDVIGLAETRRQLEGIGVETIACPVDLREVGQIDLLARRMLDRWAGVDLLVNNAGRAHYGPAHEAPDAEIEELLAVNLHAPIRLTRALLPALLARPESHVLNVCSVLGLTAMPRVAAYCASKHALVGWSDALRAEYGRQGVGVTTLCPGFVRTSLLEEAVAESLTRRSPPGWLCVSERRVAAAAVRGIERNRARVVVDPVGRVVRAAMRSAPGAVDWMQSLGRWKRVRAKREELNALHSDEQHALRIKLRLEDTPELAPRRAA